MPPEFYFNFLLLSEIMAVSRRFRLTKLVKFQKIACKMSIILRGPFFVKKMHFIQLSNLRKNKIKASAIALFFSTFRLL